MDIRRRWFQVIWISFWINGDLAYEGKEGKGHSLTTTIPRRQQAGLHIYPQALNTAVLFRAGFGLSFHFILILSNHICLYITNSCPLTDLPTWQKLHPTSFTTMNSHAFTFFLPHTLSLFLSFSLSLWFSLLSSLLQGYIWSSLTESTILFKIKTIYY